MPVWGRILLTMPYPIREEKRSSADPGDEPREGRLFLDVGSGNRIPLYPFIVSRICPHCNAGETYFIEAWDRKRNLARMKSFERGHTMNDSGVSDALTG